MTWPVFLSLFFYLYLFLFIILLPDLLIVIILGCWDIVINRLYKQLLDILGIKPSGITVSVWKFLNILLKKTRHSLNWT